MFWYLLQILMISWITYTYKTSIAPHETMGHILLFATLVTYLMTYLLSKLYDLLLALLWCFKQALYRIRPTQRHDGVHRLGRHTGTGRLNRR